MATGTESRWDESLLQVEDLTVTNAALFSGSSKMGAFQAGVSFGADELVEWHGSQDTATSGKAMVRLRCDPGQAQTTGQMTTLLAQAYGNADGDTDDVFVLYGIQAEAGFKEACELITGGSCVGLRCKVEDLGNNVTVTGKVSALQVAGQFSTGTTMTGEYSLVEFVHEGNIGADTIFKMGPSGGMFQETQYFLKSATSAGAADANLWLTATDLHESNDSTDVNNDYALRIDMNGTEGWIPIFINKDD